MIAAETAGTIAPEPSGVETAKAPGMKTAEASPMRLATDGEHQQCDGSDAKDALIHGFSFPSF
jgi:hypothetical protein